MISLATNVAIHNQCAIAEITITSTRWNIIHCALHVHFLSDIQKFLGTVVCMTMKAQRE